MKQGRRARDREQIEGASGREEADEIRCEVCGTEMYELHCELVCPNCGYRRDCSDP
ncbi:MAG: hypothetical protein K6T51_04465 [Rubrobacteraceae bacterium]|nr:hypothetical protein [Rubrobacteraceae bacterium]